MVTGVETAGLVLAAIPLIISALEHYDDFAAPTKAFIHWRRHLRRLMQELYVIRASYDQAIHLLLKPFAGLADQTTMIEDPRSELWIEGDIADNLRDRLGLVYRPFILTVDEVSEILVEIASCLNIPGSHQVCVSIFDVASALTFRRLSRTEASYQSSFLIRRPRALPSFAAISNSGRRSSLQ